MREEEERGVADQAVVEQAEEAMGEGGEIRTILPIRTNIPIRRGRARERRKSGRKDHMLQMP